MTVGELPNITGTIANISAQNEDAGVSATGVFSSYSEGAAGRPSSVAYDAKADSVKLNFGSNIMHNNISPCVAAHMWERKA